MALKVPKVSSLVLMGPMRDDLLEGAFLCLYQNNVVIDSDTVLGDLVEADFDGYGQILLTGWSAVALNADDKAQTTLPRQDFECTGILTPNDIYGIFVLSAVGDLLYVEENPTGPITVNSVGQLYGYLPRFTDQSEF